MRPLALTTILLVALAVVVVVTVSIVDSLTEPAYASHSNCNVQDYSTPTYIYHKEECYYYDLLERLIKYTLYEYSKYIYSDGYSESTTKINETWSYSGDSLSNHCYEYNYTYKSDVGAFSSDTNNHRKDCESYDSAEGRLVYKLKIDESDSYNCNLSGCRDEESKDNREDTYVYDEQGQIYQQCYTIDKRTYHSGSSTSEHTYYLSQCDKRSEWVEVHEGESIPVQTWLTSGYEKRYDYWSGSTGNDKMLDIKSWYDTQTKRIYTTLYRDWSYSYSGCCSGYGTVDGSGWDSLCYPYAVVEQNYLIINDKPTGNEDGTFYRADKFEYRVKGIYLLRNDSEDPCYITSVSFSGMSSSLSLDSCIAYSSYGFCKWGIVSIAPDASYGIHTIDVTANYRTPWYRYWTTYYYCWSNIGGSGCKNEAPKSEYNYSNNSYPVNLATADVRQYNPQYQFRVLPYLAIADPADWSYEKGVNVVIHYLGNKDQNGNINEGQRVLINGLQDKEYAYEVLKGYGLPNVDPEEVKKELSLDMRFRAIDSSGSSGGSSSGSGSGDCLDSTFVAIDSDSDSYTDELLLLQEGYYGISLHYIGQNMQDIMLDLQDYQLADSTLQQRYYTKTFTIAGYDTQEDKELFDLEYVYPARQFYATVVIKSVKQGSSGGLEPLPVYKIKIEFQDYTGSLPLYGYTYAKYQYDILKKYGEEDRDLAYKPLCLEDALNTYRQTVYEYYNTAQGVAWVRLTSLLIGEKAKQALEAEDILDIPIQYALQAPTPYTVKVTIQPYPYGMEKSREYVLPAFQQYQQFVYYANNGFYIWTDKEVKRYGDSIVVNTPRYFKLEELTVGYETPAEGWVYKDIPAEDCRLGCTVPVGYGRVNVTAEDEWFGTALASFPPAVAVEPPSEDPYIGWTMFAVTVLVSFFIMAVLRYLRRLQQAG